MQLINRENIEIVDIFTHMYGDLLNSLMPHYQGTIEFKNLLTDDNEYKDIMGRVGNVIFISREEAGKIGLTDTEMLAAIAHEIGHIVYNTRNWQADCEQRADMLAADLGLGSQMIRAIEKILDSRRYQRLTALLIQRIHFLQNMMRG